MMTRIDQLFDSMFAVIALELQGRITWKESYDACFEIGIQLGELGVTSEEIDARAWFH